MMQMFHVLSPVLHWVFREIRFGDIRRVSSFRGRSPYARAPSVTGQACGLCAGQTLVVQVIIVQSFGAGGCRENRFM